MTHLQFDNLGGGGGHWRVNGSCYFPVSLIRPVAISGFLNISAHLWMGCWFVAGLNPSQMYDSQIPLLRTPLGPEKCLVFYRVSLLSGLRKMYGAGLRKLPIIRSVHIKLVSVKWGFTVVNVKKIA